MTTIDIEYKLFREDGNGDLQAVTSQADLDLQGAISDKDGSPYVTQEVDPENQCKEIDEHVIDVFTDLEIDGNLLDLPAAGNSRWSANSKKWETVEIGGSTYYPVYKPPTTTPLTTKLFLMVSTLL